MTHIPVLLEEVQKGLALQPNDTVLDGTIGRGGHASILIKQLSKKGVYIGVDLDKNNVLYNHEVLKAPHHAELFLIQENFKNIKEILKNVGREDIDKVFLDLGWNSNQLESSGRGFSFLKDEPLMMTYAEDVDSYIFTAYDIVNKWEEKNIADIIYNYSDERSSRKIAKAIIEARRKKEIETSKELADIIEHAIPRRGPLHPATKTFQALRITVNDEIRVLQNALENVWEHLSKEGRVAVISFHSIEDRVVKRFFHEKIKTKEGTLYTKKPITPSLTETKKNTRARSAKLRIIIKNI